MADKTDDPNGAAPLPSDIAPISISDEMRESYLSYAMSVIVSRALPDVRDGLKPVHRRILYSMHEQGYVWNRPHRKSARVVGDVIGKYHPHSNDAVYFSLVRMAQEFSLRVTLIDGQGNFGSVDGDMPAAMRYTEVRMEKVTDSLLDDIDKDTVDFKDNYDASEREPTVLPARFPNLLVNGGSGIAVGMATNIPTHNLGEVIDAVLMLMDNPGAITEELMTVLPGPDFPTGAIILGRSGIRQAYETGRGAILIRGKAHTEEMRKEREAIIITEIPYQVNKATMIEKMAELVRDKRIEGISDIRDESDRNGMRVVIELKRDAVPDVVLNQLYRFTPLQGSFGCNFVALNGGKPELMSLKQMLVAFLDFREVVVTRRTRFLLNKARDRAHILVGLAVAVANVDEVIALIRTSPDPGTARERLMARDWPARDVAPLIALIDDPRHRMNEDGTFKLSDEQARAILALTLSRLTALGVNEIGEELAGHGKDISEYLSILRSRERVLEIVRTELTEIKEQFNTPRLTVIDEAAGDFEDEDLIAREDMVVTVTHGGYIKRVPLTSYRAQRRGGKGRSGMATRDEDFVSRLFIANTHTPVLFFSSAGQVYKMKVWRLPIGEPQARGKALINMLPLDPGERITSIMPLPEDESSWQQLDVMFSTIRGTVRRNSLADFVEINKNGKIAMKLDEGDGIVDVATCTANDDVLLTTALGQAIRFQVDEVRVFKGRDSTGVRGISLAEGDRIISMAIVHHFDAESSERSAYLKMSRAVRGEGETEEVSDDAEDAVPAGELSQERYAAMSAAEQFILTISENGYGKRTSSHEYRITGRGGKGIVAMAVNKRNGPLIGSFPVEDGDQIMLVTNGGQVIRVPVDAGPDNRIRIVGRSSQGVTVFNTADGEKVVSVERISEPEGEDAEPEAGEPGPDEPGDGTAT
ncbi:DNA gyrase subunit A [Devosia sp. Root413D1]|uniref:DNA gyrase subunit A n=1 Tax=unclassified Devosia TaxID=196773 RepID=UPI0006F249D7|nr:MULTISPECIES: DNA gyrase subunit A [unclassified Devosia]KQU96736.1 DNA gyrase subunit A [Devosia sp. Root105]KQW77086.1 DNA gyrase subunit A [Devosia sp. Root413D1]